MSVAPSYNSIIFSGLRPLSGPVASTSGVFLNVAAQTYNDNKTNSSSTAANFSASYLGVPTLSATNSGVTTTTASTLTIAGAPIAGANATVTNPLALNVLGGKSVFNGNITAASVNSTGSIVASSVTSSGVAIPKIQTGSANAGSNGATVTINFPIAFSTVPLVIGNRNGLNSGSVFQVQFANITTTSFQSSTVYTTGGSVALAGGDAFTWIAIGT